jgi:hypothetical protein
MNENSSQFEYDALKTYWEKKNMRGANNTVKEFSYRIARGIDEGLKQIFSPLSNKLDEIDEQKAMLNPRYVELREKAKQEREAGSTVRSGNDVFEELDILMSVRNETLLHKSLFFVYSSPTLRFTRTLVSSMQRVRRGWADSDTWSLDHHIANTLSQQLFYLADNTHGWPQSDLYPTFEDWQNALRLNAAKLREYADRDKYMNASINNWIELEEQAISDGKEAMRWVAENFDGLWD